VDSQARIVGLIHGGARCQIAVPTTPLVKVVSGAEPAQPGSSVTFHVTTDPAGGSGHFGPFKWQKTKDGFQFEFHFNWNWDSTKKP
jgi:hypothetical protein